MGVKFSVNESLRANVTEAAPSFEFLGGLNQAPKTFAELEGKVGEYDMVAQMTSQAWGVGTTLLFSGIGSAILFKVVDVIVGLRVPVDAEREGLDITDHTERAYNM